ncbi:hypothetical protein ACPPVV_08905 [Rhodanobacter sp. Col0626]|uniref:hypothetical protein n=1 Tax=Rhodanobacter sp. Col0626 TaxID=3415679 RepID=UPI003CEE5BBC
MKKPFPARKMLLATIFVAGAAGAMSVMAADQAVHVRGTITAVSSSGFTVQTTTGATVVALSADTHITGVLPSNLDAIQPGSFIGSANVVGGSMARAQEVVVFPPSMKGSGLGDYPWDLPMDGASDSMKMPGGSMMHSAMTNGTVKNSTQGGGSMMHSAMTNGTVKTTHGAGTRTIVVDYGKGEKTIVVTANTPVVTFKPADKSAIVKGAHVFVAGKPGNPVDAAIVAVGIDGTVPPM